MGISTEGDWGTGAHATSASSFTFTTSVTALTNLQSCVLIVVTDNVDTTSGETNLHTSITGGTGTWSKVSEYTNGEGAAGAGVTTSLWIFDSSGTNAIGTVFTINLASAVVEKCCTGHAFTRDSGNRLRLATGSTPQFSEVDAATGFGSSTISGLTSKQYLWIRALGKEGNSTGNISPTSSYGTFGVARSQNATSAVIVRGERRVLATTTQTSNPSMSLVGDTAGIFVAIEEYTPAAGITGTSDGTLDFTMAATGILRDTRTNVALYSEDFTNTWWLKTGLDFAGWSNAGLAPDGLTTAELFKENTANQQHGLRRDSFSFEADKWYTISLHIKADVGSRGFRLRFPFTPFGGIACSATFDPATGAVTNLQGPTWPVVTALADGWYRVSITALCTTTGTGNIHFILTDNGIENYAGDGVSTLWMWGAQIEEGENPSTYKATTADPISGPWFPKVVGTETDGAISFSVTAQGVAAARATLDGVLPFTVASTGKALAKATASGGLSFTVAGSGTSRITGQASGSLGFTGAATGLAPARGQLSQALSFSLSSQGVAPVKGQASGDLPFTGAATGKALIQGVANGTLPFALFASSSQNITGALAGELSFTVSATGVAPARGQLQGLLDFTSEITGEVILPSGPVSGEAAGLLDFTLQALGQALAKGSADGVLTFTVSAQGIQIEPLTYKVVPAVGIWPRRDREGVFWERNTEVVWPNRERTVTWG